MKKPVKGYKDNNGKLVDEKDFVDKLKEIAEQELGWWSGKTEKDAAGEERIDDEYIKLLYPRGLTLGDDEFDPKKDAWSALFIVYVVWKAAQDLDLETPPLTRTVRHIMYAHKAYEKREAAAAGNYWALPRTEPPQIGDIVVKQRMSSSKTKKNGQTVIERFFRPRIQFRELVEKDWGETHGDLVTASGSTLTVIGGNVSDTVKEASYSLKGGAIDNECLCGVAWPSKGTLSRADYRRYIEKKYSTTVCPNNNQCLVFTVLRLSPVAGYIGSTGTEHRHVLSVLKVPDVDDKSVVAAVWKTDYARRGEGVKLEGGTAGIASGTAATLDIYRHDPEGSHTVVEQLSGTVEDDKVTADWTFEYEGDVEELPDMIEGAEEYLPPRYFFELVADGESARSGLLEFKDRMELELVDKEGKELPNLKYAVRFADGSEDSGAVDAEGLGELVDIPPGPVHLSFSAAAKPKTPGDKPPVPGVTPPPKPKPKPKPKKPAEAVAPAKGRLLVEVKDEAGNPVEGALVDVPEFAAYLSDTSGIADFGEVDVGPYTVTIDKSGYGVSEGLAPGPVSGSGTVADSASLVIPVKLTKIPDPCEHKTLTEFIAAVPTPYSREYLEQLWEQHPARDDWHSNALSVAKIDVKSWTPDNGFLKNKQTLIKVYAYYASLYNQNNAFRWAAMAKLAGGEVYRGLQNELQPRITAYEFERKHANYGEPGTGAFIGALGVQAGYAEQMQARLLQMQKDIFFDLAWQHQAFVEGGIDALECAHQRGELQSNLLEAWHEITSGDETKIRKGNKTLLRQEQFEVLQGGTAGKGHYKKIQDIPDFDMIPSMMSAKALSPIPKGKPFIEIVPGGDITEFNDRWKWITNDMLPAFERLPPSELKQLVDLSLRHLATRNFP